MAKTATIIVTARDVLTKTGAPLPGMPPRTPPPGGAIPNAPMPPPGPEAAPAEPEMEPGLDDPEGLEPDLDAEPEAEEQPQDLRGVVDELQQLFSDEKLEQISGLMMALIPLVGPEHGEDIAKVYSKLMEAMMTVKANLASILVMALPAQQMQQTMQQLTQPAANPEDAFKTGPLT